MKNMKMSKSEQKSEAAGPTAMGQPEYPYGLCIRLEKDELIKLGFTGLPKIGDTFAISAKAVVQSVSMGAGQGSEYASVGLQITDMDLEADGEDKKAKAAKMLFGGMK